MKNMKVLKCGGNMYVILVYDINLENKEGQRVLRNVFKTCKKYLVHIQNSVFEADLDYSSFLKLKEKLIQGFNLYELADYFNVDCKYMIECINFYVEKYGILV